MMNEPPVGIVAVARIYLCFVLVVVVGGVFLVRKCPRKISFKERKKKKC